MGVSTRKTIQRAWGTPMAMDIPISNWWSHDTTVVELPDFFTRLVTCVAMCGSWAPAVFFSNCSLRLGSEQFCVQFQDGTWWYFDDIYLISHIFISYISSCVQPFCKAQSAVIAGAWFLPLALGWSTEGAQRPQFMEHSWWIKYTVSDRQLYIIQITVPWHPGWWLSQPSKESRNFVRMIRTNRIHQWKNEKNTLNNHQVYHLLCHFWW